MDATDDTDHTTERTEPTAAGGRHPLERPRDGRVLGGVCAGIGRHLDLDPLVVRLAVVLSALLGGAGLLVYAVAWAVAPEEGGDRAAGGGAAVARGALVAVAVLVVADLVVPASLWSGPLIGATSGLAASGSPTWVLAATDPVVAGAAVVAVLLTAGLATTASWRWLAGLAGLAVVLVAVTIGTALGRLPTGDVGDRTWRPTGEVAGTYSLGVGDAVLDLTGTSDDGVDAEVVVAAGSLRVVVAHDALVDAAGSTGVGAVRVLGRLDAGVDARRHILDAGEPGGPSIRLDVRAGIGDVEVVRAPAPPTPSATTA